jgi:hypothetical protein
MAADDAGTPQEEGVPAEVPDLGTIPDPGTPTIEFPEVEAERKADAAVAEAEGTNHKVTYRVRGRELQLQLPAKLRASVIYRAGVLRDDDGAAASKLIQAVIGPEQFELVLDEMDEADLNIDDEEAMTSMGTLINDALAVFGVTPGESEASQS